MSKNYRKIPSGILRKINSFGGNVVEVRSLQKVSISNVSTFQAFGVSAQSLQIGGTWDVLLSASVGKTSKKNVHGWEIVRNDLPKYSKTFCHEIPIYGDGARNGYATVCNDREVYHRDVYSAPMLSILVTVEKLLPDDNFGLSFKVNEQFELSSTSFEEDVLFAINLLQESLGSFEVVEPSSPRVFFSELLDWQVFPPGSIEEVLSSLRASGRIGKSVDEATAKQRLELFERFEPISYMRGLGGNDTYVGAKYADDLVVFENLRYGNALYLLYADWETQSKKPRSELLRISGEKIDRVIHIGKWTNLFSEMLREQLKKRGIQIKRMNR